jgi:hypothetical protein
MWRDARQLTDDRAGHYQCLRAAEGDRGKAFGLPLHVELPAHAGRAGADAGSAHAGRHSPAGAIHGEVVGDIYLVGYDINDPNRPPRAAVDSEGFGTSRQLSVLFCRLSAVDLVEFNFRLNHSFRR